MKSPRQVPLLDRWPTGGARTVAVLRESPQELAPRYHLEFERDVDDLDEFDVAAIADTVIGQFWLFKHVRSPGGTEVMVDIAERTDRALDAVRRTLGLQRSELAWVTEYECDPRLEHILASRARVG
jgi:hypothetical protein